MYLLKNKFMMNKKKMLFTFLIAALFILGGSLLKLNHIAYANWILGVGIAISLFFLYLLITFFIKSKG
jgi:hypothetical protein